MKFSLFILGVISGVVAYRLWGRSPASTALPGEPKALVDRALHLADLPDTAIKHAFENALHSAPHP